MERKKNTLSKKFAAAFLDLHRMSLKSDIARMAMNLEGQLSNDVTHSSEWAVDLKEWSVTPRAMR